MASSQDEGWKNPNDVMRAHRIQRSSGRLSKSRSFKHSRRASHPLPKENLPSKLVADGDSLKRSNPFSCDWPQSKQKVLNRGHSLDSVSAETNKLASADFFKDDHQTALKERVEDTVGGIEKSLKSLQDKMSMQKLKEVKNATNVLNAKDTACTTTSILNDLESVDRTKVLSYTKPVLDWSLKTKMRVVTGNVQSGSNDNKLPGIDAKHLNAFAQSQFESDEWHSLDTFHKIRRCSFHYSYPKMPWMNTFPRIKSYFKSRSSFLDTSNSTVLDSLQKDWSRVFTSVYQQLRGGFCPYFYICTHQFTVLFRCPRSSSKCFLTALLSPSTRGFRELLKKEGISFQMPNLMKETNTQDKQRKKTKSDCTKDNGRDEVGRRLSHESKRGNEETEYHSNDEDLFDDDCGKLESKADVGNCASSSESDDENKDEDDDEKNNHMAFDWLEDMGLDQKDFPSLRPHNVKLHQENFRDIDNRTQSMIYMQGVDVHAFFNFLLNYPACIANSGPQYGIPPTILSPRPFLGGTLVENTVKQSFTGDDRGAKPCESGDKSTSSRHVIEISGPILPHHSLNISAILQASLSPSSVSYCTHQPSTAFNTTENYGEMLNIMTTGLSKLLTPFSLDHLGLVPSVEDVFLSEVNSMSVREAIISNHSFVYN